MFASASIQYNSSYDPNRFWSWVLFYIICSSTFKLSNSPTYPHATFYFAVHFSIVYVFCRRLPSEMQSAYSAGVQVRLTFVLPWILRNAQGQFTYIMVAGVMARGYRNVPGGNLTTFRLLLVDHPGTRVYVRSSVFGCLHLPGNNAPASPGSCAPDEWNLESNSNLIIDWLTVQSG